MIIEHLGIDLVVDGDLSIQPLCDTWQSWTLIVVKFCYYSFCFMPCCLHFIQLFFLSSKQETAIEKERL